ncbi:hypothetical protein SLS62_002785 [Diatrype stigma]|uniref:Short chain dehydrogenase n=1 Tax=Diatrype stigma TaxID=117547 RepID=A0AAN9UU22_9PEZI
MSPEPAAKPAALVTAGSAGLGAAAARLLARNGYRVAVNYHSNAERAEALVRELQQQHQEEKDFVAIRADLGSRDDVVRLVRETVEGFGGRLDAVFSIDDNAHDDDWDRAFAVNVKSHLWLLQAAKPYLESAPGGGAFVSTASLAGVSVSGSSLAYAVTKAAQIHLSKCLASMAAPHISDWAARFSDEEKEGHRQKTKLKRIVTVEDVAEQVFTFIKTRSMTGVNVVMDAGYTL